MKSWGVFILAGVAGGLLGAQYASGAAGALVPDAGSHGAWYASRAAGLAAYLCLWAGLMGGLLMSSAWFDGIIGRARLLAIHQSASIYGVVIGLAHGLVLIPDGWTHFGLSDILVPFGSYYERALSGVGTLALYLSAVVSFSFWFRGFLGPKRWKYLHYTSFGAYAMALFHGLQVGTDSEQLWVLGLYLATSGTVMGSLMVRMTYTKPQRRRPVPAPAPAAARVAAVEPAVEAAA